MVLEYRSTKLAPVPGRAVAEIPMRWSPESNPLVRPTVGPLLLTAVPRDGWGCDRNGHQDCDLPKQGITSCGPGRGAGGHRGNGEDCFDRVGGRAIENQCHAGNKPLHLGVRGHDRIDGHTESSSDHPLLSDAHGTGKLKARPVFTGSTTIPACV